MAVQFLGFRAHPQQFYDHADIFVNPSLGPEGLPLVSLEAMAYGMPCLFSALPVHQEISGEGEAAELFTTGDALNLREQLHELIQSEERRQAAGIAAREAVKRKYSVSVAAERYRKLFTQMHENA
jgi:glycosyltransferase involved in cell wall biosynthesis